MHNCIICIYIYIYTVYTKRFKGYCLLPQLNVIEKQCYKCTHGEIAYIMKGGLLYWFYQRFSLNEPMLYICNIVSQ